MNALRRLIEKPALLLMSFAAEKSRAEAR